MKLGSPLLRCALVLLALSVPVAAEPALAQSGRFDLERTKAVVSGLIEKALRERNIPSMSIALVRGDSIVWKAAFGYANVWARTPATPETIYSTGSTFKSVTATALMQLEEQGKFKLDDPVNRYLGDIQIQDRLQSEKPVSFRHMLSHWSGLVSGANTKPIWGRTLPKTLEQMVSGLYSIRPPEAKWEYNNYAFGMAGLLVEKLSGGEYEQYMVKHVLAPLGIAIAHPVYPSPDMVERMALPYDAGGPDGKPVPVEQVHFDVYPAGDIYLTPSDMARYLAMQLNGGVYHGTRIISEASAEAMRTPQFGGNYGFGFFVRKDPNGHTIISHSGGIPGQSSYLLGDVDAKVGVYFMSNSGGPPAIAEAALKLLRGEEYVPPPEPKIVSVDPAVLERYAGVYELGPGASFTISHEGGRLFLQQGNEPTKTELFATSPTTFIVKGQDFVITFVAGPGGATEKISLNTGSETVDLKKVK